MGDAYYNLNKYKNAAKYYEISLEFYSEKYNKYNNGDNNKYVLFRLNDSKSKYFIYKRDFDNALYYLNKAEKYINKSDIEYEFYNKIAILYDSFKKYDEAIENYNSAIKLCNEGRSNNSYIVYFNISVTYYKKSDYENAIKYLNIYFEKEKNRKSIDYYYKALYIGMLNNTEKSCNYFEEGLKLNNSSSKNLLDIALIMLKRNGNFKPQLEQIMKIIIDNDFKIENDKVKKNILYKYRTINIEDDNFKFLLDGKLRLSDYNYFNDPADPPIKLNKESFESIKEYINKIRISSLSKNNNIVLMWTHYADDHKGICIAYDISKLYAKSQNYILKKVKYTNKINFELYPHVINTGKYIERFISMFYLKYKKWVYENEYRIIANDPEEEYISLEIKAIYFGMNSDEQDIKLISNMLQNKYGKNIPLFKMKPSEKNSYNLDCDDISNDYYN